MKDDLLLIMEDTQGQPARYLIKVWTEAGTFLKTKIWALGKEHADKVVAEVFQRTGVKTDQLRWEVVEINEPSASR